MQLVLHNEDVEAGVKQSIKEIMDNFLEYQREGSNWTLDHIIELNVHEAKYNPIGGSTYLELPKEIRDKQACINVNIKDDQCFKWAVLSALHPVQKHADRLTKYIRYEDELNFTGIDFPVKRINIPKFEKLNNMSITLFGYEEKQLFPIYVSQHQRERHIDLLLFSDGNTSHYVWVKQRNRLLSSTKKHHGHHFCPFCFHGYTKKSLLDDHLPYCGINGPQKIKLPNENTKWFSYTDVRKQMKAPAVIVADFETLNESICDGNQSNTIKTKHQTPIAFGYTVIGITDELAVPIQVYRGRDAADVAIDLLLQERDRIRKIYDRVFEDPVRYNKTRESESHYHQQQSCHICGNIIGIGDDKVLDHCHFTGAYRGPAHKPCNLNYKMTGVIPVVFHNLKGYDSHIIMQAIGKVKERMRCIPQTDENYISFSIGWKWGSLRFIDSYQFVKESLTTLVRNLCQDGKHKFRNLHNYFEDDNLVDLLLRKQVYPYEYMDCETRFEESNLPPIESFYSSLNNSTISQEDYDHACNVWTTFDIKNLGEYTDLYVKADVLQLADWFENFRETCMTYYHLDPAHFYTSPGLAWQAALKMTAVQLELLTDIDMHLMIERGTRGGVSVISHRWAKANNPYIPDYDSNQPSVYPIYLDANNLYGWAMSQALPTHGFYWLTEADITGVDFMSVPYDAEEGYILEVDINYPRNLHDKHADYPLAPESLKITKDMLSPYSISVATELEQNMGDVTKLTPNLYNKERYVLHYRNLQFYLQQGLELVKIHRAIGFKQSAWLEPYIQFNTTKRMQAKNNMEKDFFKLMVNSVFGKTMENLRNRMDVRLKTTEKQIIAEVAKPSFTGFKLFNHNLAAIHHQKTTLYLNRPIFCGFSILDVSKTLMFDFHYNHVIPRYGNRATLLFTDTDSLCYAIETEDIYADMAKDKHMYDFSGYPEDHPLYDITNKKVVGKFKDELNGIPAIEFIGLRSKMYSLHYDNKEKKTAKGVTASVKNSLTHDMYKTSLFTKKQYKHTMTRIQSVRHELYIIQQCKITLSPYDDKRYILDDGYTTLPHGHYSIKGEDM